MTCNKNTCAACLRAEVRGLLRMLGEEIRGRDAHDNPAWVNKRLQELDDADD